MPMCGFNTKMITGLSIFAEGLFAAIIGRAQEKGISIEEAFREEVHELGVFLEALEERYQSFKNRDPKNLTDIMRQTAHWVAEKDKG